MASARQKFVTHLYLVALSAVAVLAIVVALLLASATRDGETVVRETLLFVAAGMATAWALTRLLLARVLKPTGRAASIAGRVAQGDLSSDGGAVGRDALSTSLNTMLLKLRDLVGTIRQHAHDAAAMAEE